jgi:hypothetical protein
MRSASFTVLASGFSQNTTFARFRGGDRDRRVQIAWRRDVDDVDVLAGDDGFPVG